MDILMTSAIAFGVTAVMVAYALRSTGERLSIRIRIEDRRRR